MNDADLMRLLKAAHELDVNDAPRRHRDRTPACLPMPRLVDPDGVLSADEQAHLAGCAFCRGVADRRPPGPATVLRFPFRLADASLPAAETKPDAAKAKSADGRLEAKLSANADRLVLRTRSAGLAGRAVRYRVGTHADAVAGVALLAADIIGWFTATVVLSPDAFARFGREVIAEAAPVEAGDLTADEWHGLLEEAAALPADSPLRAAWAGWAEEAASDGVDGWPARLIAAATVP